MKVKELIKQLQKMPQDLEVATSAHDNSELEIQGHIHSASLIDYDEIRCNMIKLGYDLREDMGLVGKRVVLYH